MFEEFGHFFRGYKAHKIFNERLLRKPESIELLKQYKRGDELFVYKDKEATNKMPSKLMDSLFALANNLYHADGKDFNEYNRLRTLLCTVLSLPTDRVIEGDGFMHLNDKYLLVRCKPPAKKMELAPGDKLFHTSKVKSLKELKPTFLSMHRGEFRMVESFYPELRVYFGKNAPIGRNGFKCTKRDDLDPDIRIYEYKGPNNLTIYHDPELGGDCACYVETSKPLPVIDVTSDWVK